MNPRPSYTCRICLCSKSLQFSGINWIKWRTYAGYPGSFCEVNICLVSLEIFKKVSAAISYTPGCFSCINSFSFLMTVFKKGQCPVKKVGNCPTTYIMSEATNALFDLPWVFSQRFKSSLTTETTNLFSSSMLMHPEMDPNAQHNLLSLSNEK